MSEKIERLQRYADNPHPCEGVSIDSEGEFVRYDAAQAREQVLVEALTAFIGTGDYIDANVGWHGTKPPTRA